MKLSRLKELRPDVWEEAMRQCINQRSVLSWDSYVKDNLGIDYIFNWRVSDQGVDCWSIIYDNEDFTIYDQWLASQTNKGEPQSKIDLEYWRYKFAGMAMQGYNMEMYADTFGNKWAEKVATDSVYMADTLIKELQNKRA